MRLRTVVTVFGTLPVLAALMLAGGAAAANGGNSANAKLCQQGGWETLTRSDGSSFANTGACVSYAARGGEFGGGSSEPTWTLVVSACSAPLAGFTCANATGSGLQPGTAVTLLADGFFAGSANVDGAGNVSVPTSYQTCDPGSVDWHATGTAADGTPVTSETVPIACA